MKNIQTAEGERSKIEEYMENILDNCSLTEAELLATELTQEVVNKKKIVDKVTDDLIKGIEPEDVNEVVAQAMIDCDWPAEDVAEWRRITNERL